MQVGFLGQHLGLEPAHLAGRRRSLRYSWAFHDPAQGGIVRQPASIIHVLVSGQPPEDGLPKLSDQRVAAVLARPDVGEGFSSKLRQSKRIIEFAKRAAQRQTSLSNHGIPA